MPMLKSAAILGSVVAGVLIGYFSGSPAVAVIVLAMAFAVRFVAARGLKKDLTRYLLWTRLHSVWPCLLLCGIGILSAIWHLPYPDDLPSGTVCRISGRVISRSTFSNGERYDVDVSQIVMPDGNAISCRNLTVGLTASADIVLLPGDEISYRSAIYPSDHVAPGSCLYHTYDMIRIYDGSVSRSGKANYHLKSGQLRVVGHSDDLQSLSASMRERIAIMLGRSSLGQESVALVTALLTGDREEIDPDRLSFFRDAGVAHALAVSGMHVGIVGVMLLWLTLPLNLMGGRRWRYTVALAGTWAFTILTGLHYSTLRAAFMLTLASLGRITERSISPFSGLCMAAMIIVLLSPAALWDVGFQLSFTCVAALTLFMEPCNPIDHHSHPITFRIIETILTTIIATGATWVISARYFGSLPIDFLSSNIVMLPLLPAYMMISILYLLLFLLGVDAVWLAYLIDAATSALYSFLSLFNGATIRLSPTDFTVALWMCGVATLAYSLHRYRPEARTLPGAVRIPVNRTSSGGVPVHRPTMILSLLLFASSLATLIE